VNANKCYIGVFIGLNFIAEILQVKSPTDMQKGIFLVDAPRHLRG